MRNIRPSVGRRPKCCGRESASGIRRQKRWGFGIDRAGPNKTEAGLKRENKKSSMEKYRGSCRTRQRGDQTLDIWALDRGVPVTLDRA